MIHPYYTGEGAPPFGRHLERLRRERELGLRDLAIALGVSAARVSDFLRGYERPSLDELGQLAVILDVSDADAADLARWHPGPLRSRQLDREALERYEAAGGVVFRNDGRSEERLAAYADIPDDALVTLDEHGFPQLARP